MDLVLLDKQERVGTLTLNRPEKLNAMNPTLLEEFFLKQSPRLARMRRSKSSSFGAPGGLFRPAMTWPPEGEEKPSIPTAPSCKK